MKKILLLCTAAFLLSCSNDDDSNNGNNDGLQRKLTKVSEKIMMGGEPFGEGSLAYVYHENGFLKSTTSMHGNVVTYTYNTENQLTKVNYVFSEDPENSYYVDYVYENGIIKKEVYSTGKTVNHSYNSNGNLIESVELLGDVSNVYIYDMDDNGNLLKMTRNAEVFDSATYDTKTNPYQFLYPEPVNKIKLIGKNNIMYQKHGSNNMVYEYNSQNFPIKSTNDRNGMLGDVIEVREYSY